MPETMSFVKRLFASLSSFKFYFDTQITQNHFTSKENILELLTIFLISMKSGSQTKPPGERGHPVELKGLGAKQKS